MLPTKFHFHWLRGFQRRRLKCEKLTDDRRRMPSNGKSSHCLWHLQCELKMYWIIKIRSPHSLSFSFLIDDAGHHISDQSKILLQQHDFYKTLYSTTNLDCNDESFFNHNIKLTEEQKRMCPITEVNDKWKKSRF